MADQEKDSTVDHSDFRKDACELIDMAFNTTSDSFLYRTSKPILNLVRDGLKKAMECTPEQRAHVTYIQEVSKWDKILKEKGHESLPSRIRVALHFMDKNKSKA